ncbi:MAG: sigma-70 family RNA polymerase sigma factor [Armatimonadetes bacterium]|nr:sigma-70 family RNA polymerase sigma factor [Armatimonadota bacterium]
MSDVFPDDVILIERSQAGDRQAFDTLIRKHEKRAYMYAYRLTSNAEIASDIVSDAFVRIFNALGNFRGQSAFTTWLYRIITNCYLDLKKKDKSKFQVSLDAPVGGDGGDAPRQVEDPSNKPDELSERNERERMVQQALKKLPEYQQTMLTMFHVDNLTYDEIAEILDLPIGTVKSRLNRARLGLRELLAESLELFDLA